MSKSEKQWSVVSGRWSVRRTFFCLLLTAYCLLFFVGCRQDMQDQPRYEAYEPSAFFKDGLSSRALPEGTVARGYLMEDKQFYTGKMDQAGARNAGNANNAAAAAQPQQPAQSGEETTRSDAQATASAGAQSNSNRGAAQQQTNATNQQQQPAGEPDDVETFPFPITAEVLNRGQERYEIFCSLCHGATGYGDGMIVRRGFRKPPSYHEPRLQQARVGHIFRVITEGYGAMPPHRSQIPVQDRWAIIAYVRVLQFSQQNTRTVAQPQQPAATSPAHGGAQTGGHE